MSEFSSLFEQAANTVIIDAKQRRIATYLSIFFFIFYFPTLSLYKYIHTDNDGDYYIEVKGNTIYIYFEESDSWGDWMSNFDFPAKSYKNGNNVWHCHRGFLRVWKTMREDIENDVISIIENHSEQPVKNIICAGYSHGAALCGLCVEDMEYLFAGKYDINVYGFGFGCPRFTWGKLPTEVKDRFRHFYAFRNDKDIVTHVPPKIFGYGHGKNKIFKIKSRIKYGLTGAHYPIAYLDELACYDTDYLNEVIANG
jgi:hypothetical protein